MFYIGSNFHLEPRGWCINETRGSTKKRTKITQKRTQDVKERRDAGSVYVWSLAFDLSDWGDAAARTWLNIVAMIF